MSHFCVDMVYMITILINIGICCINNDDCSLLGICNTTTKECKCKTGFYGVNCNFINLSQPINWNIDGYHNTTISTWDGSPIKDENNTYHLFISIITNNCPLNNWRTNSIIGHVISINNAIGPYILSDIALYPNMNRSAFDGLSVYNPAIIQINDTYILYYTATSDINTTSKNCSSADNGNNIGSTQRIGLAISKSLYGPWIRSKSNPIIIPNNTNKYLWNSGFVTNPAPLSLKNGSIAVVYKAKPLDQGNNPSSTMYHGIAITNNNIHGPYITINDKKPFNVPTYCADPFLWSSANDTIFHILFQCHWNCSQQIAYSHDLLNWNYKNIEQFWCDFNLINNTNIKLLRRERPALLFNENEQIKYLFSAVQPENGRTFNSVQQIL